MITAPDDNWIPIPSAPGYMANADGLLLGKTGRILKPTINRDGYLTIAVSLPPKKIKTRFVHHLVAEAFGLRKDGLQINHINGVRGDNRPANLESCTQSENMRHRREVLGSVVGGWKGPPKIKAADLPAIRERLARGETINSIAKDYGVSRGAISSIKSGRSWTHV